MDDRQDRLDKERMSRLLETAAIVNAPLHFIINGIKFWLGMGFGLLLCIVLPIHSCLTCSSKKAEVNTEVHERSLILRVDYLHPVPVTEPDRDQPSVEGSYVTTKTVLIPFGIHQDGAAGAQYFDGNPIEFCNPDKQSLLSITTPTGVSKHWAGKINFFFDSRYWAAGKSAPMYDAYATAAYTVTAMRRELAGIQHGTSGAQVCRTLTQDDFVTPENAEEITATEADIHIDHIPVVWLALLRNGVQTNNTVHQWTDSTPDFLIAGLCIEKECTREDFEYDIPASHDLSGPTFTDHQTAAMVALRKVTTDEFWLATARANGIHDNSAVLAAAARNRAIVDEMFPESPL